MPAPRCPICLEDYSPAENVRPHIIAPCGHAMCLSCCKTYPKCGTCNGKFAKSQNFKLSTELEGVYEQNRRLQNNGSGPNLDFTATQMEELLRRQHIDESNPRPIEFYVCTFSNKSYKLNMKLSQTFGQMKQEIKRHTSINIEEMEVLYNGRINRNDEETLADMQVRHGCTVQVVRRVFGARPRTLLGAIGSYHPSELYPQYHTFRLGKEIQLLDLSGNGNPEL